MSGRLALAWEPPGPVSQAFMASDAPAQVLNGPVGSGKTTTALMKGVRLAEKQFPSKIHTAINSSGVRVPVRQFKLCVVRDTYRQLWRTTLPSWWSRVPRAAGTFTGAENAPATHRVTFEVRDGTLVDYQADFVAIGENSAEEVLRGYEPTAFLLEELDTLSWDVFVFASGRTGRFPPMADCGSRFHGILATCNAPVLNSEVHRELFKPAAGSLKARGIALFRQPGGRSPGAENLKNLPADYYTRQVALNATRPDYVGRMVDNRAGFSREGKPVYLHEYNDALHCVAGLRYIPGIPLGIGLDAGLNPAAVFRQRMPNGQRRIIAELVGETGTGATRFGEMLARKLKDDFPDAVSIVGWADPSSQYGADKKAGEQDWMQIVAEKAGIIIRAAPTNNLEPRLEAVRLPLTRLIDGQPGFLLSDECVQLREGFNSTYCYKKRKPNEEIYDDEPEKNEASHPHDALQYDCSGDGEHREVHKRHGQRGQSVMRQQQEHVHDWNPFDRQGA